MQPGVCQRVRSVQGLPAAPRPELVHTGRAQPFRALVPELEMYFDRQWDLRIEMAPAAPLPSGFADQSRQMIGGVIAGLLYRLVAALDEQIPGAPCVVRGAEQVQIVLRPQSRVRNKLGPLRSALQEDVWEAGRGEPLANLMLQRAAALQALGVLDQVPRDACAHPIRQRIVGHCAEYKCQRGAITEIQQLLPREILARPRAGPGGPAQTWRSAPHLQRRHHRRHRTRNPGSHLEIVPNCELQAAGVADAQDASKKGRPEIDVRSGNAPIRMIEYVESFGAEFQRAPLAHLK